MRKISVSAITMDPLNIERDIQLCNKLNVDQIHLDIMDGHNVPRFGIYPEIAQRICDISDIELDAHIMCEDVEFTIKQFANIKNLKQISFHLDGREGNALRIIDAIREIGAEPVLILNLSSGFDSANRLIEGGFVNRVLMMGIHPGVLKQTARPDFLADSIAKFSKGKNLEIIQVDGGVTFDSIPKLAKVGVNNFVVGSSTFYKGTKFTDDIGTREHIITNNYNKIKELFNV